MTPSKSLIVSGKTFLPSALQDTEFAKKNVKWGDVEERIKYCKELLTQPNLVNRDMANFYASYIEWSSKKSQKWFQENLLAPGFNLEELKTLSTEPDNELIFSLFKTLRERAELGVSFEEENLDYLKITNGLCSAVSLHWIYSHLQAKKAAISPKGSKVNPALNVKLPDRDDLVTSFLSFIQPLVFLVANLASSVDLLQDNKKLSPLPKSLEERVHKVAQQYLFGASKEVAASQNAFNAIAIDKSKENEIDLKRAKVQSLANLYSMRITAHTESEVPSSETFKTAQNLRDGVYLIRGLRLDDSHKGELHGHSQALLKEKGELIFQDPCFGTIRIPNNPSGQEAFTKCMTQFWLDEVRFYKMELAS